MDLFQSTDALDRLEIQGAEIYYSPRIELPKPALEILDLLVRTTPWRAEQIVVWGKSHPQPRLVAWYGDDSRDYSYSGIKLTPLPWTDLLLQIKESVEGITESEFNSVLLNYYRDNRDSMGFHSDDEAELGTRPTIASLSLGEERTFILKPKAPLEGKPVRIKLGSGSLLLMKGDTQKNWKHGIDKESRSCGPRVNLTFRRINSNSRPK